MRSMEFQGELFVIGAYEVPTCAHYPYHASPIIVEKTQNGYVRKSYCIIPRPYCLIINGNIGGFFKTTDDMFPHPTFIKIKPHRLFKRDAQLVVTGSNSFVYGSSKLLIVVKLAILILKQDIPIIRSLQCCLRVFI